MADVRVLPRRGPASLYLKDAGWGHTAFRIGGGVLGGVGGSMAGAALTGASLGTMTPLGLGLGIGGGVGGEMAGGWLADKMLGKEEPEAAPQAASERPATAGAPPARPRPGGPTLLDRRFPAARMTSGQGPADFYAHPGQGGLAPRFQPSGYLPPGGVSGYGQGYFPGTPHGSGRQPASLTLPGAPKMAYATDLLMAKRAAAASGLDWDDMNELEKRAFLAATGRVLGSLAGKGVSMLGKALGAAGRSLGTGATQGGRLAAAGQKATAAGGAMQRGGQALQRPAAQAAAKATALASQQATAAENLVARSAGKLNPAEAGKLLGLHGYDESAALNSLNRHGGFVPAMEAHGLSNPAAQPGLIRQHLPTIATMGAFMGLPMLMGGMGGEGAPPPQQPPPEQGMEVRAWWRRRCAKTAGLMGDTAGAVGKNIPLLSTPHHTMEAIGNLGKGNYLQAGVSAWRANPFVSWMTSPAFLAGNMAGAVGRAASGGQAAQQQPQPPQPPAGSMAAAKQASTSILRRLRDVPGVRRMLDYDFELSKRAAAPFVAGRRS